METIVQRSPEPRIDLFDADGQWIGSITRPVEREVTGPGREKVYLARRSAKHCSQAA